MGFRKLGVEYKVETVRLAHEVHDSIIIFKRNASLNLVVYWLLAAICYKFIIYIRKERLSRYRHHVT